MKLSAIAVAVDARMAGDDCEVQRVSSIADADDSALVYALTPELLARAQASAAGGVIVGEFANAAKSEKPLLLHRQPKLAFARAARMLSQNLPWEGIHATAIIAASARLGDRLSIGPYAVVGECAVVGEGTRIGAHSVIAAGVQIGSNCVLHPQVTIYPETIIGDRVVVHSGAVLGSDGFGYVRDEQTGRYEQFPQLGQLIIEDEVEIGANTAIDRGALKATIIRRGVKIDNLVHIAHNVTVGEDVVIAAQTGVSGSSEIERRAVIAGQVGIADHVRIEEGAILGAQCGVPSGKVVRGDGVVFWGTPARPIKEYLRQLAALAKLGKKG